MDREPALVPVYYGSQIDAQRARSVLVGHGVDAVLRGEHIGTLYGIWGVNVLVRAEDVEAARDVLVASGIVARA